MRAKATWKIPLYDMGLVTTPEEDAWEQLITFLLREAQKTPDIEAALLAQKILADLRMVIRQDQSEAESQAMAWCLEWLTPENNQIEASDTAIKYFNPNTAEELALLTAGQIQSDHLQWREEGLNRFRHYAQYSQFHSDLRILLQISSIRQRQQAGLIIGFVTISVFIFTIHRGKRWYAKRRDNNH